MYSFLDRTSTYPISGLNRTLTSMDQPSPQLPPRPWYYHYWFLFAAIFLWPAWPVLILRSPWNNSVLVGGVAWAMLIIGVVWVALRLPQGGTVTYSTLAFVLPGLIIVVVTHILWRKHRRVIIGTGSPSATAASVGPDPTTDKPVLESRRRRRRRRRHGGHAR